MRRYPNLPVLKLRVEGETTAVRVFHARTFTSRLFGLLGRRPLAAGEALLIEPCGSVHTVGMRYAIDLALLDAQGRVVATRSELKPLRLAAARGAKRALELPAHSLGMLRITPGTRLTLEAA